MNTSVNRIITSKTRWWHLVFLLVAALLLSAFIYLILIPYAFWGIYGEGAKSERIGSLPLVILLCEWLPLIIVLSLLGLGFYLHVKNKSRSTAKSYLLTAIVLMPFYVLRFPILDYMFTIFQ